ncbi:hypothetical protein K474DRAFT_1655404 [Panus rudis PR-1116 ss-1]|nr:hypothetical protein K474DRAFT_1655404 [Panus rudis PR-1116 ss-1]
MASMFPAPSPKLPEFRTLLIQGPYHPSAPIHLCLSHNATHDPGKTLLLAPSRANLVSSLREFNDEWISEHGGDGSTHKLARDVNILYPPSPAHMDFVFSMLHEARPFDREDFVRKTTLDEKPTLVVICEPSSYFLDDPDATYAFALFIVTHQQMDELELLVYPRTCLWSRTLWPVSRRCHKNREDLLLSRMFHEKGR